ncbi:MAG TPA: hypothetical protein VM555_00820 [Tahibacter sp.]|nr:hypothetical protein [Tahibacter sp.]
MRLVIASRSAAYISLLLALIACATTSRIVAFGLACVAIVFSVLGLFVELRLQAFGAEQKKLQRGVLFYKASLVVSILVAGGVILKTM